MAKTESSFVYVTYIRTTAERLWHALTEPEFQKQYWFGVHCESEWTPGSSWRLISESGQLYDAGSILESDPPRRLVISWRHQNKPELNEEGDSRCEMDLETIGNTVKLSVTHTMPRQGSKLIDAVGDGWPRVLSNLKSLLETGTIALDRVDPATAVAA